MAPKTEKGRAVLAIVTPLAVAAGIVVVALPWSWGRATTRGGTDSAERPSRLWLVACAVLGWFAVRFIQRATFALRAYQRGCLPAAVYPHRDVLLGLDAFVPALRAIKANTFFELTRHRFASVGNTFWTNNLGQWVLMTIEPENIKALLASDFDNFAIAGPRLYGILPGVGPRSIFTTNGQAWHDTRAKIRPSFVRDQVADLECFNRHIGNLIRAIPKDGRTFDLQELSMAMTMDSSTDFMVGASTNLLVKPDPEAMAFVRAFETTMKLGAQRALLGPLASLIPNRRLDEAVRTTRSYISHYMRRAMAEVELKKDSRERAYVFFDEMVKLGVDDEYLRDQLLSIITAGRDTTAQAVTSCFYFLARDKAAVDKCRAEIAAVGVEHPTWEQLKNMKYLNNVVKEALRLLTPVATNSRASLRETVLPRGGGRDGRSPLLLPKGTPTRFSPYSLHRRKDIYGEDADEFRPERWEELRLTWEYIPFSGGPRICIGQQFALTQLLLTLYRVLSKFRAIEARDPHPPGPPPLRTSTTIAFADGCLVSMTPE